MIINKDYLNKERNYLEEERKGLEKAINRLDERFQNKEIERDKFFKDLNVFTKRGEELKKRMEKDKRR